MRKTGLFAVVAALILAGIGGWATKHPSACCHCNGGWDRSVPDHDECQGSARGALSGLFHGIPLTPAAAKAGVFNRLRLIAPDVPRPQPPDGRRGFEPRLGCAKAGLFRKAASHEPKRSVGFASVRTETSGSGCERDLHPLRRYRVCDDRCARCEMPGLDPSIDRSKRSPRLPHPLE